MNILGSLFSGKGRSAKSTILTVAAPTMSVSAARAFLMRFTRNIVKVTVSLPGLNLYVGKFRVVFAGGKFKLIDYHSEASFDILAARRFVHSVSIQNMGAEVVLSVSFRPIMGSYPVVSIHLQDVDPKAIEKYAKMTDQEAEMEAEAPVDEEGMDEGDMLATAAGLK